MTTAFSSPSLATATFHPTTRISGPVIVASDGSPQSDAAFSVARLLAERLDVPVHVVSALTPFAMPMYAFDTLPVPLAVDYAVREGREGMLKTQQARLGASDALWPVTVRTGEPAREIVEFAQEQQAGVIVVGRGRHAALERALGGETVLRLLQLGDTPVLAAEAKLTALPRRVVVATDFSEFSLHAARLALAFIAPDARVFLVHVGPPFAEADAGVQDRATAYRNEAIQAMATFREGLVRDGLQFEDVLVEGNPSNELIKIVRAKEADLVVSATHGYGFLRRMIMGSVAAQLVRNAPCSVLCVPGSAQSLAAARARHASVTHTHALDMAVLDAELRGFSERNERRRCTVEIDERELGAQILGHALPFVGATYDRAQGIVSLMFGASELAGHHLTHGVPGVTAVDVSADGDGRDRVLRVSSARGQVLVLLE